MKIENVKVEQKLELIEGTSAAGNAWKKQGYVVKGLGQYDKAIYIEVFGKKVDEIQLEVGQIVTLNVDAESREYNGRWYTTLQAWSVEDVNNTAQAAAPLNPAPQPISVQPVAKTEAPKADPAKGETSEVLPF